MSRKLLPGAFGGKDIRIGTRVAFPADSAWQSSHVLPAGSLGAVPDDISDDVASQMLVKMVTARHALLTAKRTIGRRPSHLLLTAAAPAVGKLITVLALRDSLSLTRPVRSSESAVRLAELRPGDDVIATEKPGRQDAVRHAADGDIPLVIDGVGARMVAECGSLLNVAHAMVSFGLLDGGLADLSMFLTKAISLRGATIATWKADSPPGEQAQDAAAAIDLARTDPRVFKGPCPFDLSDLDAVFDAVTTPRTSGNVLLSF